MPRYAIALENEALTLAMNYRHNRNDPVSDKYAIIAYGPWDTEEEAISWAVEKTYADHSDEARSMLVIIFETDRLLSVDLGEEPGEFSVEGAVDLLGDVIEMNRERDG